MGSDNSGAPRAAEFGGATRRQVLGPMVACNLGTKKGPEVRLRAIDQTSAAAFSTKRAGDACFDVTKTLANTAVTALLIPPGTDSDGGPLAGTDRRDPSECASGR